MSEAKTLSYAAQMAMDLYNQDFESNDDFFGIEHFIYCCKAAYGKLLNEQADESRKINFQINGQYTIELSEDWTVAAIVKFVLNEKRNRFEATLPTPAFSFKHDSMGSSVQAVNPLKGCRSFVKICFDAQWQGCYLPAGDAVMFFVKGDKLIATNANCELEAEVYYIPGMDSDADKIIIPDDGSQMDIVTSTYNVMATVREKVQAIDMTNNQNANKAIQTEVDSVFTNLKTRKV